MTKLTPRVFVVMLLAAICDETSAAAQDPTPKFDRYGDPLPSGAVARLGTRRFRAADLIEHLAISRDGKTLATVDLEEIAIWDLETGKKTWFLAEDDEDRTIQLALSEDGKTLTTVSEWAILRTHDLAANRILNEKTLVRDSSDWTNEGDFTRDGRYYAFNDRPEKAVRIWDAIEHKEVRRFKVEGDNFGPVAVSLDRKTIAAGSRKIAIWDVASTRLLQTLDTKEISPIRHLRFALGDTALIVSPVDVSESSAPGRGQICMWDWKSAGVRGRFGPLPGTCGPQHEIVCSDDGKRMAAFTYLDDDEKFALRVWDLSSGRVLYREKTRLESPMAFTPSGSSLIARQGRLMHVRNFTKNIGNQEPKDIVRLDRGPVHMIASADGRWLAMDNIRNAETGTSLWDLKSGEPETHFVDARIGSAFSGDAQFAYVHRDGSVRLCDSASGKELRRFSFEKPLKMPFEFAINGLIGMNAAEVSIAFDHDAGRLLATRETHKCQSWRVSDGEFLDQFVLESKRADSTFSFSADGRVLLEANGKYRAYDTRTGKRFDQLGDASPVVGPDAVLSPDGRALASAAIWEGRYAIVVRDTVTGKTRLTIPTDLTPAQFERSWRPSVFSPDGTLLAVHCRRSIEFRSVVDGKLVHEIKDVQQGVTSMCFVGNHGERFATGGQDGTILIWAIGDATRKK